MKPETINNKPMLNTIRPTPAFAVFYKRNIPYTSAPEMLGGGAIYQVYKNEEDALNFLEIPFVDAKYEMRPVIIFDAADIHLDEAKDI
jgi:hypothetical protein